jgi:hypothetical protein
MYARLSLAILTSAGILPSAYAAGACQNLSTFKLQRAAITSAQVVEAGAFTLPSGGRAEVRLRFKIFPGSAAFRRR